MFECVCGRVSCIIAVGVSEWYCVVVVVVVVVVAVMVVEVVSEDSV